MLSCRQYYGYQESGGGGGPGGGGAGAVPGVVEYQPPPPPAEYPLPPYYAGYPPPPPPLPPNPAYLHAQGRPFVDRKYINLSFPYIEKKQESKGILKDFRNSGFLKESLNHSESYFFAKLYFPISTYKVNCQINLRLI